MTIQHVELPEAPIHVTEHRLAVYRDADGHLYIPDCPELKGPIFGPRLLATIGWLKSMAHCSCSTIEARMEGVLRMPASRGYPSKLCTGTISGSLGWHVAASSRREISLERKRLRNNALCAIGERPFSGRFLLRYTRQPRAFDFARSAS